MFIPLYPQSLHSAETGSVLGGKEAVSKYGIGTDEIKEIIMEHIKTKGFNVTEDDISFVIGKEETVTGNTKKIKHALIRCDIQIER